MARHLIVTEPFGQYAKGDRITSNVQAILAARRWHVVAIATPDDSETADALEEASLSPEGSPEPAPEVVQTTNDVAVADLKPAPEVAPEHTEA